MTNEALVALIGAGSTIIVFTAGYVIWNVKRLVTDVAQLRTHIAVIGSMIKEFPKDHDNLIRLELKTAQNEKDITEGLKSIRTRIDELTVSEH